MKTRAQSSVVSLLLAVSLAVGGCAGHARGVLPTRAGPPAQPALTLVWVGYGAAERFDRGVWQRTPEFDYEFTVEQRRYADHWESVKHMRRRHPAYDGSAGPRELTYFFRIDLDAIDRDGRVPMRLTSTLGAGEGRTDREFRDASLVFRADVSSMAPFDTYRIDQRYGYERGVLEETVSLDKGRTPWVRNLERATLFASHAFSQAPTRL